jgi:hypothetical protein
MSSRVAKWTGGVLGIAAGVGLVVYFVVVGLDKADKLASVIGVFLGLAGIALASYGVVVDRALPGSTSVSTSAPPAPIDPPGGAGRVHNEISGGIVHGLVIQAGSVGPVGFDVPSTAYGSVSDTANDPPDADSSRAHS